MEKQRKDDEEREILMKAAKVSWRTQNTEQIFWRMLGADGTIIWTQNQWSFGYQIIFRWTITLSFTIDHRCPLKIPVPIPTQRQSTHQHHAKNTGFSGTFWASVSKKPVMLLCLGEKRQCVIKTQDCTPQLHTVANCGNGEARGIYPDWSWFDCTVAWTEVHKRNGMSLLLGSKRACFKFARKSRFFLRKCHYPTHRVCWKKIMLCVMMSPKASLSLPLCPGHANVGF